MAEANEVECDRCGAAVPLVSARHARCVYCSHDQEVPADVARAVHEDAALDAKLEHAAGTGERTFQASFQAGLGLQIFLVVMTLLGGVPTFYLLFTMADGTREGLLRTGIYGVAGLSTILMAGIPLLWLRTLKRSKEQVFATLPLAHAIVEHGELVADCPRCGARLTPGTEVAVACTHCQTQSLLPRPMVQASLRQRHQRVIELRLEGEAAAQDATKHAVSSWQKNVVPMIIRFNILLGALIAAAVIAYQLSTP